MIVITFFVVLILCSDSSLKLTRSFTELPRSAADGAPETTATAEAARSVLTERYCPARPKASRIISGRPTGAVQAGEYLPPGTEPSRLGAARPLVSTITGGQPAARGPNA